MPDSEQIRCIFRDTYVFYTKWKGTLTIDNHNVMMQEAYALEKQYPFDLCTDMLPKLIECIEDEYKRREHIE